MKKWFDRLFTALVLLILAYVVAMRAPQIWRAYQKQGEVVPAGILKTLSGESARLNQLLPGGGLLIFWATWCGPCTLEIGRVQKAVASGELSKQRILLVSIGEDAEVVRKVSLERGYSLPVALDPQGDVAATFGVEATPTSVLLTRDGKIHWLGSGVSPTLVARTKKFFAN